VDDVRKVAPLEVPPKFDLRLLQSWSAKAYAEGVCPANENPVQLPPQDLVRQSNLIDKRLERRPVDRPALYDGINVNKAETLKSPEEVIEAFKDRENEQHDLEVFTVPEIVKALKSLGQDHRGKKEEVLDRLLRCVQQRPTDAAGTATADEGGRVQANAGGDLSGPVRYYNHTTACTIPPR
jgi:hypothetical protein